jgi:hypothetical protein
MKAGTVVRGGTLLGTLVVLASATALAGKIEDKFRGGFDATLPWTWAVPGNNPVNTEDPTHYSFSTKPGELDIMTQGGSLYANANNARNIPNLPVLGQPDSWFVETAVKTDWSMASNDAYVHAGFVFFTDADNYYTYYYSRAVPNAPMVQVTSNFETSGNPSYGNIASAPWSPTTDYVGLRVAGTADHVTFQFKRVTDTTWQTAGTLTAANFPNEYMFMSNLVGKNVGLVTDTGGGMNNSPFTFKHFETNLVVTGCQ